MSQLSLTVDSYAAFWRLDDHWIEPDVVGRHGAVQTWSSATLDILHAPVIVKGVLCDYGIPFSRPGRIGTALSYRDLPVFRSASGSPVDRYRSFAEAVNPICFDLLTDWSVFYVKRDLSRTSFVGRTVVEVAEAMVRREQWQRRVQSVLSLASETEDNVVEGLLDELRTDLADVGVIGREPLDQLPKDNFWANSLRGLRLDLLGC